MPLIDIVNWNEIKDIVEGSKFKHEKWGDVVVFTNGNGWYIDTLIKNLNKSIQVHDPNYNLMVFCTDDEGYTKCKDCEYEYYAYADIPLLGVSGFKNLTGLSEDEYHNHYTKLCFVKIVLMRYMLENGYTPLYIDPDMALGKPAIEDILGYLEKAEVVVAGHPHYINTNVMLALPSSNKCKEMYQLSTEVLYGSYLPEKLPGGDEPYVSTRIRFILEIPFICLDPDIHIGGAECYKWTEAKTYHANCTVGLENKVSLLKRANVWYI